MFTARLLSGELLVVLAQRGQRAEVEASTPLNRFVLSHAGNLAHFRNRVNSNIIPGFPREAKRQLRGFGDEATYQLGHGWGREIARQIFGPPKGRRGR